MTTTTQLVRKHGWLGAAPTKTIKAIRAKAGQTIVVHHVIRADTGQAGDLTIHVSHDVRYGQFQADDDPGVYIHGERDDGATYPARVWDQADVDLIGEAA